MLSYPRAPWPTSHQSFLATQHARLLESHLSAGDEAHPTQGGDKEEKHNQGAEPDMADTLSFLTDKLKEI